MKLTAKLREIRASHDAGTDDLESREVTVEAPSYDEAVALVEEQTPAGVAAAVGADRVRACGCPSHRRSPRVRSAP